MPHSKSQHSLQSTDSQPPLLHQALRHFAKTMLIEAIEHEVSLYIQAHQDERDPSGCRMVVRNGRHPKRIFKSCIGNMEFRLPRINDRRTKINGERHRFKSTLLPAYLRTVPAAESTYPWVLLSAIKRHNYTDALAQLVGTTPTQWAQDMQLKLKELWASKAKEWVERNLSKTHYDTWLGASLTPPEEMGLSEHQSMLILIGVPEKDEPVILGIDQGTPFSTQSWKTLLAPLYAQGLKQPSKLQAPAEFGLREAILDLYASQNSLEAATAPSQPGATPIIVSKRESTAKEDEASAPDFLR